MEQKEISINGKKFIIHELLATEFDEIQKIEDSIDKVVGLVKRSASISDEDYNKLTVKERDEILVAMNNLNGWDFRKSETEKKD